VTSTQIQLLGSSTKVPQIVAEFLIDTTSPSAFELRVTWGRTGQASTGLETRVVSGSTSYDFTLPIPADAVCGGSVTVEASAGTVTASTTTVAGPCAASTAGQPTTMPEYQ